ncbi:MAG: energy-coupling factor ABC transporter ATP-binding protein [Candidatus Ancillula sp.]|jgi:energy-coupling factor transporter ATP-binding protein EcfA2|nr:energy-coupling factor ABC transporter ATP-binding protein [Candidatus Ancillula sp.]
MSSSVKFRGVSFAYSKGHQVLKDLTFQVRAGQVLAVVGQNGSGKSTIAGLIAGLIKLPKNSGELNIVGRSAIVFQNPDVQVLFDNVEDDIKFVLDNYKVEKSEHARRITDALSLVKMLEFQHSNPLKFSLGQKQRIAIASILALDPEVIIFDEATSSLDSAGKRDVLEIVEALKDKGKTVIMVTNVVDELRIADSVLLLQNGAGTQFDGPSAGAAGVRLTIDALNAAGFALSDFFKLKDYALKGNETARGALELLEQEPTLGKVG